MSEASRELSKPYEWEFIQAVDTCRKLYIQTHNNPEYIYAFYDSVKMLRTYLPNKLRRLVKPLPDKIPVKGKGHIAKASYKIMMMKRIAFETFEFILDIAYESGLISEVKGFTYPAGKTSEQVYEEEGPMGFPETLSVTLEGGEHDNADNE